MCFIFLESTRCFPLLNLIKQRSRLSSVTKSLVKDEVLHYPFDACSFNCGRGIYTNRKGFIGVFFAAIDNNHHGYDNPHRLYRTHNNEFFNEYTINRIINIFKKHSRDQEHQRRRRYRCIRIIFFSRIWNHIKGKGKRGIVCIDRSGHPDDGCVF